MYNSLLARRWQFSGKLFTLVSFDKSGGAQPTPSGKKVMDMVMTRDPGGVCAVWESRSGGVVRGACQQCVCVCVYALSTELQRQDYLCHQATVIMSPPMTPERDADQLKGWTNTWMTDYLLRAPEILTRGFWALYAARGEDQCWDVVCCALSLECAVRWRSQFWIQTLGRRGLKERVRASRAVLGQSLLCLSIL